MLLIAVSLAGCIGSEAGGNAAPADDVSNDSAQDVDDTSTDDAENKTPETDPQTEDGADEKDKDEPPRTPTDAMEADPDETKQGMARWVIQDSVQDVSVATACIEGTCGPEDATFKAQYDIHIAEDIAFLDVYMKWDMGLKTDLDLYLYNSDGEEVMSSARGDDEEYLPMIPADDQTGTYTLEVQGFTNLEPGTQYEIQFSAWTVSNYTYNMPWQVLEKRYEIGQAETAAVSITWSPMALWYEPTGAYGEESFDMGGVGWIGCTSEDNVHTNGNNGSHGAHYSLPCPATPYSSLSIFVNDDVAGQQVGAFATTCSNDGDNTCGETNNVNDTVSPGPNELEASFCGVIQGFQRDSSDDADGTGPGVYDQRGETYEAANGTEVDHPGVNGVTLFFRGPQRGGAELCSNADAYTGPTTGTVTLILG